MHDTATEALREGLESLLRRGIETQVFPAAQAAVGLGDGIPVTVGQGRTPSGDVSGTTRFDIASLTKIFTASACLRLVDAGVIDLQDRLDHLVPGSFTPSLGAATVAELLSHEAGLVSWLPLFEAVPLRERGLESGRRAVVEAVLSTPLAAPPGTRGEYSDLGYILLMRLLESVSGLPLDRLIRQEVTRPLRLESAHFRPLAVEDAGTAEDIAPTEACPWRGRVLTGEVHDDNAWTMGGVSGHAGLFATATDIASLGRGWLCALRGDGWLSARVAEAAVTRRPSGRGLGWDIKSDEGSSAGGRFGPRTFGHLGFTGCSLWVDPDREVSVALLTNRVNLGRDNNRIRSFRPAFHDALMALLEKNA